VSSERHVLLIADQPTSAADLRQLLARAGYRVTP
jgi:PleD family two-component response regulator